MCWKPVGFSRGRGAVLSAEVQFHLQLMARQRREVFSRLASLPPTGLFRRPESGAWSIGENLIHATMAARSFLGSFRLLWPLARLTALSVVSAS